MITIIDGSTIFNRAQNSANDATTICQDPLVTPNNKYIFQRLYSSRGHTQTSASITFKADTLSGNINSQSFSISNIKVYIDKCFPTC